MPLKLQYENEAEIPATVRGLYVRDDATGGFKLDLQKAEPAIVRCRTDLASAAEKAAFIRENGRDAYLDLPTSAGSGITDKGQLHNDAMRRDFIRRHGVAAFLALPDSRPTHRRPGGTDCIVK